MPKYDAFGREIGEDPLAEQGWRNPSPPEAPPPHVHEVPQVEVPQVEIGDPAVAAPPPPPPAFQQPLQSGPSPAQPVIGGVRRRRRGGGLVRFVIFLAIVGFVATRVIGEDDGEPTFTLPGITLPDFEAPKFEVPEAEEPAQPVEPVSGLRAGSLIRAGELRAAMAKLRSRNLGRLTNLSVRPERVDAQLLTRGGRIRVVQVVPGPAVKVLTTSGPGFGGQQTIPFDSIRTAAPERLTRTAARRLKLKVNSVDYLVLTRFDTPSWVVYFKNGRYVIGDGVGRFVRAYP